MARNAAFGRLLDGLQCSLFPVFPFLAALGLSVRLPGHHRGISHLQLPMLLQSSYGCQGIFSLHNGPYLPLVVALSIFVGSWYIKDVTHPSKVSRRFVIFVKDLAMTRP